MFSTPPAMPDPSAGAESSRAAVAGGMTVGPPSPTSSISADSTHTAVVAGAAAIPVKPATHQQQSGGDDLASPEPFDEAGGEQVQGGPDESQ